MVIEPAGAHERPHTRPPTAGAAPVARCVAAALAVVGAAAVGSCGGADRPTEPSPVAAVVRVVSGSGQSGTAGAALPEPVVARVTDAGGRPVPGVAVTFVVGAGGGAFTPAAATTDAGGEATARWTLGTTAGTNLAAVYAPNLPGAALTATGKPGAPARLVKGAGDAQLGALAERLLDSLEVRATDEFGNGVRGVPVAWAVSAGGGAVAPAASLTDDAGRAVASWTLGETAGAYGATATADGLGAVSFAATAVDARVELRGQVLASDAGTMAGVRVSLRTRSATYSTDADAAGRFSLAAQALADSVDVIAEAPTAAPGYHPALVRLPVRALPPDIRVVLVPKRWTIPTGIHANTAVDISPNSAFAPPCANEQDINCDGFYPKSWFSGIKLWADAALPIPVALDRAKSHEPLGTADSVALWTILRAMEQALGRPTFRSATAEEMARTPSGWPSYGILVWVDTTMVGFSGWTSWSWDANQNLSGAVVRLRRRALLASTSLVMHEMLHTLGFKHSCSWSTVMGGYGCASAASLTPGDVAYAQLAARVREVQATAGTPHGLVAALQGQRVLTLRLPPYTPAARAALSVSVPPSLRGTVRGMDEARH